MKFTRKRQSAEDERGRARVEAAQAVAGSEILFVFSVERVSEAISQTPEFVAQRVADVAAFYGWMTPCEFAAVSRLYLNRNEAFINRAQFEHHVKVYYAEEFKGSHQHWTFDFR